MLPCAPALLCAAAFTLTLGINAKADAPPSEAIPVPAGSIPGSELQSNGVAGPADVDHNSLPDGVVRIDKLASGEPLPEGDDWDWHWLPSSLIYHSYWAGEHEPRMGMFMFGNLDSRFLWDASLGGRVGFLQYGNGDPINPAGYQLDFYGAAHARLDANHEEDLDSTDYVFGFPITWGDEHWQWKCGYAHLSSHMGDEFAISHPGALNDRINYVRDSIVLGTSYYVTPAWRVYGETGWAFNASGGAEPWDVQFGTELSRPGPTTCWTPFVAANVRLREELDFGGDATLQFGWLRRSILDHTLRIGGQYYNGKSNQFEFFPRNEQQLGVGLWYDF
jgi:hypothetical protein